MTWKRRIKFAGLAVLVVLAIYLALPQNHFIIRALIYQHVNIDDYTLFHNRTVKKGIEQPWAVSTSYNTYNLSEDQLKYFDQFKTVAYLVIKDTAILSETYWDGYGQNSISNSFSMAKSIVSLLVGCAVQDGFIKSIDEPIGNYLPEFKEGDKGKVTIKHLLTMSSGLSWDESYSSLFSLTTKGYYGKDLPILVLNQEAIKEPGKLFEYRSGDTQLLSLIVEKATGKHLADYASERIWSKIGAENDALWCLDRKDGVEKAFCCFNSNARDFARFGQLILNNGQWNGEQIISSDYLKESFTPADYLIDSESGKPCNFYGYQWWMINFDGYDVIYARGILGQYIFAIPELNAVIVRLGHIRNNSKVNGHPEDVHMYLKFGIDIVKSTTNQE
ncbi:MAG: serine hydrolase [Bacteroidales bacterium]|nr:MAG: serine hydrolase [Bacteroidales bacterium]